jgi:hypothetical protein
MGSAQSVIAVRLQCRITVILVALEIVEREDGVIELRPTLPVPVDELWFWTEGHQAAEREAEEDLQAGRYRTFDDSKAFLAGLELVASETDQLSCNSPPCPCGTVSD